MPSRTMKAAVFVATASLLTSCSQGSEEDTHIQRRPAPSVAPSAAPATITAEDDCGLGAYSASRTNREILADAPVAGSPTSSMLAKVRVDAGGRVTHLRLVRRAYPEAPPLAEAITLKAIQDLKDRHFSRAAAAGRPGPQCMDIAVTIDLR